MTRIIFLVVFLFSTILIDLYAFGAIKTLTKKSKIYPWIKKTYWTVSILSILSIVVYSLRIWENIGVHPILVTGILMVLYMGKLTMCILLFIDDLRRGSIWVKRTLFSFFGKSPQDILPTKEVFTEEAPEVSTTLPIESKEDSKESPKEATNQISRSLFLSKSAIALSGATMGIMSFGIISGVHDYRVRRRKVVLKGLPKAFDGIRIAQVSDIHSGSFFNKVAVEGGVDILLKEKPDMVFFTGDLVNNVSSEVTEYLPMFSRIKAPLGVFSVLGNHDYGDYAHWKTPQAKVKNLQDLIKSHHHMGWDLLMDEHKRITIDGSEIAILGVQNWGDGRFPKYGNLAKAYQGTEEISTKILLSHDPSHWDAQIRPQFPDIDLTLAGHTHGMQCGVEIGDFRWSPIKLRYKQWADLYKQNNQYLYVNRGYGFLGFPGRIGMLPEITILELVKG